MLELVVDQETKNAKPVVQGHDNSPVLQDKIRSVDPPLASSADTKPTSMDIYKYVKFIAWFCANRPPHVQKQARLIGKRCFWLWVLVHVGYSILVALCSEAGGV
jgi:hypothetical protein